MEWLEIQMRAALGVLLASAFAASGSRAHNAVLSMRERLVRAFYDSGIRVTVNSDDPSMFGTDMNNEYLQLHEQLGFTVPELFLISLNAVDFAFLPEEEKNRLRANFHEEIERLT